MGGRCVCVCVCISHRLLYEWQQMFHRRPPVDRDKLGLQPLSRFRRPYLSVLGHTESWGRIALGHFSESVENSSPVFYTLCQKRVRTRKHIQICVFRPYSHTHTLGLSIIGVTVRSASVWTSSLIQEVMSPMPLSSRLSWGVRDRAGLMM